MQSRRSRLDRFIGNHAGINRRDVRLMLAQGRVVVDGKVATDIGQVIEQFSHVVLDTEILQADKPIYVMLNKPVGVVSATRDDRHTTVIDLLERDDRAELHIAGRLDFNSSGLLLLTNDGQWSRQLSSPEQNICKLYWVKLEKPITEKYIQSFAEGLYFAFEGITTRPARLRILNEFTAEIELVEGRYHQIKRMFGRFDNRVLELHRLAVGEIQLDPALAPGQSRELTTEEILLS